MEDQQSICTWAETTFGECSMFKAFSRCAEEFAELEDAVWADPKKGRIGLECADVLITLYRVAELCGYDLHALVNEKMTINRARKWNVANGVGQHVK